MPFIPPGSVCDWYPARLLQEEPQTAPAPFALVVLNQPLPDWERVQQLWSRASYRVAADGGANRVLDLIRSRPEGPRLPLDVIIGDLDSLRDDTRAYFAEESSSSSSGGTTTTTMIRQDPDQDSTDFGKAMRHVQEAHPGMDVVVLGSTGGRVDQGISQLHHLYVFQAEDEQCGRESERESGGTRHTYLLSPASLTFLLPAGQHRIHVPARAPAASPDEEQVFAKHVGFLPLAGPSRLTTHGLEWDVADWPTQFGGQLSTSNHVLPATRVVAVAVDQPVVFTIALRGAE